MTLRTDDSAEMGQRLLNLSPPDWSPPPADTAGVTRVKRRLCARREGLTSSLRTRVHQLTHPPSFSLLPPQRKKPIPHRARLSKCPLPRTRFRANSPSAGVTEDTPLRQGLPHLWGGTDQETVATGAGEEAAGGLTVGGSVDGPDTLLKSFQADRARKAPGKQCWDVGRAIWTHTCPDVILPLLQEMPQGPAWVCRGHSSPK